MRKSLCALLSLLMLIPLLVSCGDKNTSESYIEGYDFIVKFGDVEITAEQINASPKKGSVVIYTRDYMIDDDYSLTVGEEQKGRIAFSIRRVERNSSVYFEVSKRYEENIAEAIIPVNGFVITIPASRIVSANVKEGSKVEVSGYEYAVSSNERHNLATFAPQQLSSTSTRRINFLNPINGFKEDKIYFVNSELAKAAAVSVDNVAVYLKKSSNTNYDVESVGKADTVNVPAEGSAVLIFTGKYNMAYANHYFGSTERIAVSMLNKANGYSDLPAVNTVNGTIEFADSNINASSFETDGAFVFDYTFSSAITPATDKKRVDVAIVEGVVAKIYSEGERALIPAGNGFIVTFVGDDALARAQSFRVGNKVETCLIDYTELPDMFVEIGNTFFEVTDINKTRNKEGMSVLYTSEFGASTKTNEYGSEIVIKDGKVVSFHLGQGNAQIPEGGYVLSVHNDNLSHVDVPAVKTGDEVEISLSGPAYNVINLNYNAVNEQRVTDSLILYKNIEATGTNGYGYEIAVDKNGFAVGDGFSGDMEVPEGGFVLSGHGINKTALQNAYTIGERVVLDVQNKGITVIRTPDLKIKSAEHSLEVVSDLLDKAKQAFFNIEYKKVSEQITYISSMLSDAKTAFDSYDFDKAFSCAQSVVSTCQNLKYDMIESKNAESRAVWYRSTEKSDAEVEATIKKIKSLNINALYLETWYEGYCIGNKVEVEGVDLKRNANFDALEAFIRIGHENGIEVHAWVHNFFVGYFYKDGRNYHNPVFVQDQFKDKYLIDRGGNEHYYYTTNGNYWLFLNPNDRECRDLLLGVYKELITKYELDGLHLDYVRYPELNMVDGGPYDFGYNQDIIDGFKKKTGIIKDPRTFVEGSADQQKWVQYRCDIITSFVGEVYDLVRKTNSDIWLSAATYPDIKEFKQTIFQDVATFAEKEYFDEFYSMSYGIDNKYVIETVNGYTAVVKNRAFYTAGLAAFLETTQESFAYQLTEVVQNGADGVAVFALGNIGPDTYQDQIVLGAFKNPSVQVNKFSLTAAAQMDYICNKVDNVNYFSDELSDEQFEFIKSQCKDIKEASEQFDLHSASDLKKAVWAKDILAEISSAKTAILAECGYKAETKAFISDFEDLEYWLNMSILRLNK